MTDVFGYESIKDAVVNGSINMLKHNNQDIDRLLKEVGYVKPEEKLDPTYLLV